jgi:hypothetical protein
MSLLRQDRHDLPGGSVFVVSVQHELAAAEPGFHFPFVLRVVSLCSLHCFTGIVLAHGHCLPGTVGKTKVGGISLGGFVDF